MKHWLQVCTALATSETDMAEADALVELIVLDKVAASMENKSSAPRLEEFQRTGLVYHEARGRPSQL